MRWRAVLAVAIVAIAAAASFTTPRAGGGGGVTPNASGYQNIASGPGVYAQTTAEYAGTWSWTQTSASYDYYWYIFTSSGTLVASGHKPSGGGDHWTGPPNIYYFKEYNNEPIGSGRINSLQVTYCC